MTEETAQIALGLIFEIRADLNEIERGIAFMTSEVRLMNQELKDRRARWENRKRPDDHPPA